MDDEDSWEGDYKCPACGGVWFEFREGGGFAYKTACNHLRFICLSEDKAVCFNDLTLRDLNRAISPPLPTDGTDTTTEPLEPDASLLNEHLLENYEKNDFWPRVKPESFKALFSSEECGGSILFGTFFDPPLADAVDGDS